MKLLRKSIDAHINPWYPINTQIDEDSAVAGLAPHTKGAPDTTALKGEFT